MRLALNDDLPEKRLMSDIYQFTATSLEGQARSLAEFKGQVLLIVNTASYCGFTKQFAQLQELHDRYSSAGFSVLGFPCNQFGKQEPGSSDDIASFCQSNYGVTFPMFEKVDVNGSSAHPLFNHLKRAAPGMLGTEFIKWNFTKFLVSKTGETIARYAPKSEPEAIAPDIERLLATS